MHWGDLVVQGAARRQEIRARDGNGVDGVEVREGGRRLVVYFLEHVPAGLHHGNVRIDGPPGGRRVTAIAARRAAESERELEDRLLVELDHPGCTGPYVLRIVERRPDGRPGWRPYRGIDPRYAQASFRFDVDGPRPPILRAPAGAAGAAGADETVSYLSRDYAGLRQLMLDRLAVTMPEWSETHEPDLLITLVELLAYIGDDLSYYEDAVATEAYLQTARNRISVRRHARLVDYRLHEGCSARAWVCVAVTAPLSLALNGIRFATAGSYVGDGPPVLDAGAIADDGPADIAQYSPLTVAPGSGAPAPVAQLIPAHNAIGLWSWGELDAQLQTGATSAVLRDGDAAADPERPPPRVLSLRVGDVIVLEETADPLTGGVGPADPTHRQAVRLTAVRPQLDALYGQPLVEVQWAPEDALTFELAVMAAGRPCAQATGNVILAGNGVAWSDVVDPAAPQLTRPGLSYGAPFPDPGLVGRHQARWLRGLYRAWRRQVEEWLTDAVAGTPLSPEQLDLLRIQVGEDELERIDLAGSPAGRGEARAGRDAQALDELLARAGRLLAPRRRRLEALAHLAERRGPLDDVLVGELAQDWGTALTAPLAAGQPGAWGPAADPIDQDPRTALPIALLTDDAGDNWPAELDLIGVAPTDRAFVAEIDDQGIAHLRINDPPTTGALTAHYWVGNGTAGNAEIEAINALVWTSTAAPPTAISLVRNPLPVTDGIDPETTAAAKLAIPGAFLDEQPRALSVQDYAALAAGLAGVRSAAAQLRFTGAVSVVDVAIQPAVGEDPSPELLAQVRETLDAARRIGHLVQVLAPRYRPLIVALDVVLAATAIRRDIARQLARLLSSGSSPGGQPALFHPADLRVSTPIYASPIIAAVHGVTGVQAVTLTRFGFLDEPAPAPAASVPDELVPGTLEIARLDNDRTHPEHGYALVSSRAGDEPDGAPHLAAAGRAARAGHRRADLDRRRDAADPHPAPDDRRSPCSMPGPPSAMCWGSTWTASPTRGTCRRPRSPARSWPWPHSSGASRHPVSPRSCPWPTPSDRTRPTPPSRSPRVFCFSRSRPRANSRRRSRPPTRSSPAPVGISSPCSPRSRCRRRTPAFSSRARRRTSRPTT